MLKMLRIAVPLLAMVVMLAGCSGDRKEKKQGALDHLTDKVAQEAVQDIRKPMEESANRIKSIQEAHMKAVDEAVGKD